MTTLSVTHARFVGFGDTFVTLKLPRRRPRTLPERFFCDNSGTDVEFFSELHFEDEALRPFSVSVSAKTLPFALLRLCTFSFSVRSVDASPGYALASKPVFSGYAGGANSLQEAEAGSADAAAAFFLVADRTTLADVDVDMLLLVSRYVRARVLRCLVSRFAARFDAMLVWLLRLLRLQPALLFLYGISSYSGFARAVADFGVALTDMDTERWKKLRSDAMTLEMQLDDTLAYFITASPDAAPFVTALTQHACAEQVSPGGRLLLSSQQAAAQWLPALFASKCRARLPARPLPLDRPAEALASRDVLFVELPFPFSLCRPLLRGEYALLMENAGAWLSPGGKIKVSDAAECLPLIVIETLEWWTPRELLVALQQFMRREEGDPLALSTAKLLVFTTTPCFADDDGALHVSRGVLSAVAQSHRVSLADNCVEAAGRHVLELDALPAAKAELLRWVWLNVHFPPSHRLSFFFSNMLPSRQRPLCLEVLTLYAAQELACFSSATEGLSVWRMYMSLELADTQRAALVMRGEQLYFAKLLALLCFFERVAVVLDDGASLAQQI